MKDFQGPMNTTTTNLNQILCQGNNQAEQRENQPLLTCKICIEPIILPNRKFENSNKCSHQYCTDCITNYIKAKLEDYKQGEIKCPDLNCSEFLDPIACRRVIESSLFEKWFDLLCESAIVGVNKSYCPNSDCNALILDECGETSFVSKCPDCRSCFCSNCKRLWYGRQACECDDDAAFYTLVRSKGWMNCPRCGYFVENIDGCSSIKCRCGIHFCYSCGELFGTSHYYHNRDIENLDTSSRENLEDTILTVFVIFITVIFVTLFIIFY